MTFNILLRDAVGEPFLSGHCEDYAGALALGLVAQVIVVRQNPVTNRLTIYHRENGSELCIMYSDKNGKDAQRYFPVPFLKGVECV